jgi:hypothetical protein
LKISGGFLETIILRDDRENNIEMLVTGIGEVIKTGWIK